MFLCLEKRDEKNAEEKKYMKNENYIYICSHFHSYYSSTPRTRHLLDICCDLWWNMSYLVTSSFWFI